ncbi:MAG: hypothetical protein V3U60_16560 [Gammaproteobacteria bacterium]
MRSVKRQATAFGLAIALAIMPTAVYAQSQKDYREEIIEYVVDVCWREMIKNSDLGEYLKAGQSLLLLKLLQKKEVDEMIDAIGTMVDGENLNLSQRKIIYQLSATVCINAATE